MSYPLTLFTFGYHGWGSSTSELVQAIDTAEREQGFRPPVFVDIRYQRSGRAVGFRDNAFETLLPNGRYRWFKRLGNESVQTKEPGIKIADVFASRILLGVALEYAKQNRRIIFFCQCEFPRYCHRHVVANLLLRDAERTGRRIHITEWPGRVPFRIQVHVTKSIFEGIRGNLKKVRLPSKGLPRDLVGLPWGSIVEVTSGGESNPIISGPAKYQNGWYLPILEKSEPNSSATKLRQISENWLKEKGIKTIESSSRPSKHQGQLKVLTLQQPWAHAIINLGKDVENRPWRSNYSGPLLIHASAQPQQNPRSLLREYMSNPPSQDKLLSLPTGAIIGVVELFDRIEDSDSKWAQKGFWHWCLRNARPLKPVECKGQLGLWTPKPSVMKKFPSWVKKLYSE